MATKRSTTSTNKSKAGQRKTTSRKPAAKKTEIDRRWSILLFALGAFFIILSFVPGSSLWLTMRENVLFGTFGISGWLLGPVLLYLAVLISFEKPVFGEVIRCAAFILALSGAALIFGKTDIAGKGFGEIVLLVLESGRTSKVGGGLVSLFFGVPLLLFGRPAANILVVLVVLVALMAFTGITPAEVYGFLKELLARVPHRAYYEPEYEALDEPDEPEQLRIEQQASLPQPFFGRKAKKGKPAVDIDIGPEVTATPVAGAAAEEVVVGPGGTFGMNPLGDKEPPVVAQEPPILPFDPHSSQSLFDDEAPLFAQEPPAASLFEEEQSQPATQDLFAGEAATLEPADIETQPLFTSVAPAMDMPLAAVQAQPTTQGTKVRMAGEYADEPPMEDPDVQAMIEKAAARPVDTAAVPDNRPAADVFAPYRYPPASLFAVPQTSNDTAAREEMHKTAELLVNTLASFGVQTRILDVSRGPSVTRYEVQPQTGVKISRITNLADDIALNLAAAGVRIEAPIPGKPAVGIEVPNRIKSTVSIRSILESSAFAKSDAPLTIALGKDIAGESVVADLSKMPHLLVAGSTGSGKSVCINSIIMSLLYKSSPEDVRLVLVDPKVVELAEYNETPHLLMPVVTEPRKAASALGQMVAEMERRYRLFAENNVRDIKTYNKKAARNGDMERMYYIAIVIDELADLMMTSGKEVEDYICRLAQKARAAGMHLIVATQRPSVDVITGLIKANIPSRIAFAVSSQIDSRTILDGAGAEKLLGMGDMLFMPVGANKPMRVQGTYVQDKEISAVLRYVKAENGGANYDNDLIDQVDSGAKEGSNAGDNGDEASSIINDDTFCSAVEIALENGQISTSFLQRRLRLGYARAGRIIDQMEQLNIISPPEGSKPRKVLISLDQWQEMSMNAHG